MRNRPALQQVEKGTDAPAWRLIAAVALGVCLIGAAAPALADWQVKKEVRDGCQWVLNPATAKEKPQEIVLRELWRLGGDDEEEGEFFGIVGTVFEDGEGNLCILDSQLNEIRVYSPDGEFLRSIGRRGEGPGEFLNAASACLLPSGVFAVVQSMPAKLVLLNADGTPGGTMVPRVSEGATGQSFMVAFEAHPVGKGIGVACMNQVFLQTTGKMRRSNILAVFDYEGNLLASFMNRGDEVEMSGGYPFDEATSAAIQNRWVARADGTLYAMTAFHGYEIHVFDPQWQEKMVIAREYQPVKRTPEEKQRLRDMYVGFMRGAPNPQISIEDTYRDVERLAIGPDGNLWAQTSQGMYRPPEGVLTIYDVFDSEGRFIREVHLRGEGDAANDNIFLVGDRVVVVRNFLDSLMASVGSAAEGEEGREEGREEGVTIICYALQ